MDGAPGPLELSAEAEPLKAIVSPHIDYDRGARAYAHAYKALAEAAPADTYVIIGIAHQPSSTPYAATRNAFSTPLGRVEVDAELLDTIEGEYPGDLYADEGLHIAEHSVELQVVMLQAVLEGRPFRIVPLLASSFDQFVEGDGAPARLAEVDGMVKGLKRVLNVDDRRVCLIAAADLAHVGHQFGDPGGLTSATCAVVETGDRASLAALERGDAAAFLDSIARDKEFRKVCGVPALYTMLLALDGAVTGRLLHYEQAVTPEIESMVSFAAMAFR
jgi:AmmeMemoRadiSam system protein B